MSDREQAIDDVAKHLRCEIDAVIEACKEDELAMKYAVAQRERVIALERAMREIKEVVHRRQLPITHQIWDIADAALGDH